MPFCSCCGNELNEDANFCPKCGARVRECDVYDPFAPPTEGDVPSPETPAPEKMAYLVEEMPEARPKSRHRVLAGVLCILLALFLSATVTLGAIYRASRPNYVATFVRNCDLSSLPASVLIENASSDEMLSQWLLRMLIQLDPAWSQMDARDFSRYFDADIKPFIADQFSEFASDLSEGRAQARITKKALTQAITSTREHLSSEFGITLSDESIARTVAWLDASGVTEYADLKYWDWQYPALVGLARLITSRALVILAGVMSLLCVCLLGATMANTRKALVLAGGTMSIVGGGAVIACLFSAFPLGTWLQVVTNAPIALLLRELLRAGTPCALAIAGAGLAVLLACALTARLGRKQAQDKTW